ncbi:hypothetical protein SDC9_196010 [bioreactor metagenome]|uniref:Uncharacterized protein n=1 Tax=bioreactor metagenome TaxID=1076179 RepID=A0A645IM62_9ZZZZ
MIKVVPGKGCLKGVAARVGGKGRAVGERFASREICAGIAIGNGSARQRAAAHTVIKNNFIAKCECRLRIVCKRESALVLF